MTEEEEKEDKLIMLKALLKELYHYIYEDENVDKIEDIQVNEFEKAIVIYNTGVRKEVTLSLTKKNWTLAFAYLRNVYKNINETPEDPKPEILLIDLPFNRRFNGRISDKVESGISVSIRLVTLQENLSLDDFTKYKEISSFLISCIKTKKTILVSGATGSGKTTFSNLLIKYIPKEERIFSLEEVAEFNLSHFTNKVRIVAPQDYGKELDFTMKSTPERILLSELTTKNAGAVEKFLVNGHGGFMTTLHANNPKTAITETFFSKLSATEKASVSKEEQIRVLMNNVDLSVQILKDKNSNGTLSRRLSALFLPKKNKLYNFPNDLKLFLEETSSVKPLTSTCPTFKEIIEKTGKTKYQLLKSRKQNPIKKDIIKSVINKMLNEKTSKIITFLQENHKIKTTKQNINKHKQKIKRTK